MGSYYTLYTLVYNWFYVQNATKTPVLVGLNRLQQNFYFMWFGPFFFGLAIIGNQLRLWSVKIRPKTGPNQTFKH